MSMWLAVLLLAWGVGIAMGVFGTPVMSGILVAAALGVAGWRISHTPMAAATAALAGMGVLYGISASAVPSDTVPCNPQRSFDAVVVSVFKRQLDQTQYIVKDQSGCSHLVFVPSYTRLPVGGTAVIDGRFQLNKDIPDEFAGYRSYLADIGVVSTYFYPDVAVAKTQASFQEALRGRIADGINGIFREPDGAIVAALLLGDTGGIPDTILDTVRAVGLAHIFAVSGLHISIIAAVVALVVFQLPLSFITRHGVVAAIVWGYVSLLGLPVSAVRAAIFITVVLSVLLLRRYIGIMPVLLLAAVGIATVSPVTISTVSFQLSFMAVLGIVVALSLAPYVENRLAQLALVSAGATAGTLPIVAHTFGAVPLYGVIVNLLVVPLLPVIIAGALISLALAPVAASAALVITLVLHGVLVVVEYAAAVVYALPYSSVAVPNIPEWASLAYYIAAAGTAVGMLRLRRMNVRELWVR